MTDRAERGRIVASCSPDFTRAAIDEVRSRFAAATSVGVVGEGAFVADLFVPFADAARTLSADRPVFVRHVFGVGAEAALHDDEGDVATLIDVALRDMLPSVDSRRRFAVQVRLVDRMSYGRHDVQRPLQSALLDRVDVPIDVRDPEHVLSVVIVRRGPDGPRAYLGVSATKDNLSSWPGGMRRYAREEGQISRAEFKLLEAIEAFGIELSPDSVALDLGAAPGGWTRVLLNKGLRVVAVDPAEIHAGLASDPRVVHHRVKAAELARMVGRAAFDVVVNDMRMDARDSARATVALRRLLAPSGVGVITLKLPKKDPVTVMRAALRELERAYRIDGARNLFHDRQEVTVAFEW